MEFLNLFLQADESQKVRISTVEYGMQTYLEVFAVIRSKAPVEARELLNSLKGCSVVYRRIEPVLLEDPGCQRRVCMKLIDSLGHLDPLWQQRPLC